MAYYKIIVTFNNHNLGKAVNVFHFRNASGGPTDNQLRDVASGYIEDFYGTMTALLDGNLVFMDAQLVEVDLADEVVRVLGSLTPTITPSGSGDMLSLTTAGSIFARTSLAKARGSKRIPGIRENQLLGALFDNAILNAMVNAALVYISDRGSVLTWIFRPGVISVVNAAWADFSGTAVVTNIPGTQVTRKVGRGD